MKCPKCGKDIPDEALFCEFCGAEIKIVPEYDPGVEEQIDSGMETVKQILDESDSQPDPSGIPFQNRNTGGEASRSAAAPAAQADAAKTGKADAGAQENQDAREHEEEKARKAEERKARYRARTRHVKMLVCLMVFGAFSVLLGIILGAVFRFGSSEKTQSWYVGRAYQMASEGQYLEAADEIDKAIALTEGDSHKSRGGHVLSGESISVSAETVSGQEQADSDSSEAQPEDQTDATLYLLKAEYLQKAGEKDLALGAASSALESSQSTEDDRIAAYGRMISIYASSEQYGEIAKLLDNCIYPSVVRSYLQYTLFDPTFSAEEGVYEGALTLKLDDEGDGSIFYTLDGSLPSTSSSLYTEPIVLTEGDYTVSAVYINHFGLESNVVTKHFTIRSTMPEEPVVKPNSGTVAKETPISVEIPEEENGGGSAQKGAVYYTTDGSDPTEEDSLYSGNLMIPPGTTTFRFVYISPEGLRSRVVEREYTYKVSTNIGSAEGVNYILVALIRRGEVIDTVGTIPGGTARYSFTYKGTEEIDGVQYLRYDESVVDAAGNEALTGRSYAVNAMNGTVNLYSDGALTPIG